MTIWIRCVELWYLWSKDLGTILRALEDVPGISAVSSRARSCSDCDLTSQLSNKGGIVGHLSEKHYSRLSYTE